jgi:hypothetical protein
VLVRFDRKRSILQYQPQINSCAISHWHPELNNHFSASFGGFWLAELMTASGVEAVWFARSTRESSSRNLCRSNLACISPEKLFHDFPLSGRMPWLLCNASSTHDDHVALVSNDIVNTAVQDHETYFGSR